LQLANFTKIVSCNVFERCVLKTPAIHSFWFDSIKRLVKHPFLPRGDAMNSVLPAPPWTQKNGGRFPVFFIGTKVG
jgi:hypothetical protein